MISETKSLISGIKESTFKKKAVRVEMGESISGMKSAMVEAAEIVPG